MFTYRVKKSKGNFTLITRDGKYGYNALDLLLFVLWNDPKSRAFKSASAINSLGKSSTSFKGLLTLALARLKAYLFALATGTPYTYMKHINFLVIITYHELPKSADDFKDCIFAYVTNDFY